MDLSHRKKPFRIPQVDGGGYDNDEDYAGADEEVSSSSESDFSEAESGSGSGDEEAVGKSVFKTLPTKQKEVDLPPRRITRQQDKKKPVKVGRPSRNQEKRDEGPIKSRSLASANPETEPQDRGSKFPCTNCKQCFSTKTSLSSHLYWCNPSRITRSRTGDVRKQGKPINNAQLNKGTKSKRAQQNVQASKTATENPSHSQSQYKSKPLKQLKNKSIDATDAEEEILPKQEDQTDSTDDSDYETKLAFSSEVATMKEMIYPSEPSDINHPATCPKCKMTYRNQESLQKHVDICAYTSSSCSSEEEDDEKDTEKFGGQSLTNSERLQQEPQHFTQVKNNAAQNNKVKKDNLIEFSPVGSHLAKISNLQVTSLLSTQPDTQETQDTVLTTGYFYHPHAPYKTQFTTAGETNMFRPQKDYNFNTESPVINTLSKPTGYTITEANNSSVTKLTEEMAYAQKCLHTEPENSVVIRKAVPNPALTNTVNSVPIQSYGFSSFTKVPASVAQSQPFQIHPQQEPWTTSGLVQVHGQRLNSSQQPESTSGSLQQTRGLELVGSQPSSEIATSQTSSVVSDQQSTYSTFPMGVSVSSSEYRTPSSFSLQYNGNSGFLETTPKSNASGHPSQGVQYSQSLAQADQQLLTQYSETRGNVTLPNSVSMSRLPQSESMHNTSQVEPSSCKLPGSQPDLSLVNMNPQQFSGRFPMPSIQVMQHQQQNTMFGENSSMLPNTANQPGPYYQSQGPNISTCTTPSQQYNRLSHPNDGQVVYYQDGQLYKVNIPMHAQTARYQPSFPDQLQNLGTIADVNAQCVQQMQQLSLPSQVPHTLCSQHPSQQNNFSQQQTSQIHGSHLQPSSIHPPFRHISQIQSSQHQQPLQISQQQLQIPSLRSQTPISNQHHLQIPGQQLTSLLQSQMQISQQQSQNPNLRPQSQIQIQDIQSQTQGLKSEPQFSHMQMPHQQCVPIFQKSQQDCYPSTAYSTVRHNFNEITPNFMPSPYSTQRKQQNQTLEQTVRTGLAQQSDNLQLLNPNHLINHNQPYQMIQTQDGTTYIVVQSGNPANIVPVDHLNRQASNSNPVALGSIEQKHQNESEAEVANSPFLFGLSNESHQHLIGKGSTNMASMNLIGNTDTNIACTSNSTQSHACPCPRCSLRVVASTVADKYRKVLPFPRPIEPKLQPDVRPLPIEETQGFVKTYMRRNLNKSVKSQLAFKIMEKHGMNTNVIQTTSLSPSEQPPGSVPASRKNPVLTAVVRPMEHPLQRMSDQISQIESSFNSSSPLPPALSPMEHIQAADASPPSSRKDVSSINTAISSQDDIPVTVVIADCIASTETAAGPVLSHSSQIPMIAEQRTVDKIKSGENSNARQTPITPPRVVLKRKLKQVEGSPGKSIKVTLRRKGGGDSCYVKDVSETGVTSGGAIRNLKIVGKITSGGFTRTSTEMVVEPRIHIVPIPCPDSENLDSNLTIAEDSAIAGPVVPSIPVEGSNFNPNTTQRLTHKAVVVYELKNGTTVLFRSSNVRAVWSQIFETKLDQNLPQLSYPATNISLSENQKAPTTTFSMLGLTHRAIQFLLLHFPKTERKFRLLEPSFTVKENENADINEIGCARTKGYNGRKPFDMFGWLASKHRKPIDKTQTSEEGLKSNGISIALRLRTLKEKTEKTLMVMWSTIHGRGLYTRRAIEKGEMIIEYAGEVIRSLVCDQREEYYDTKAIGCYMFRINDEFVIDATMKGNAARFINHSCDPNCESKSTKILGKEHILIFALRKISSGEELTYDYKFDKEEVKIPCSCASKKCRKYLN